MVADISKNSNMFLNNGGVIDADRQWLHVSNSVRYEIYSIGSFLVNRHAFGNGVIIS